MKTYYETTSGDSKEVESLEMAKLELLQEHPEAIFGGQDTHGADGWRVLVWASEVDARDDDGARAIGQIVCRGNDEWDRQIEEDSARLGVDEFHARLERSVE